MGVALQCQRELLALSCQVPWMVGLVEIVRVMAPAQRVRGADHTTAAFYALIMLSDICMSILVSIAGFTVFCVCSSTHQAIRANTETETHSYMPPTFAAASGASCALLSSSMAWASVTFSAMVSQLVSLWAMTDTMAPCYYAALQFAVLCRSREIKP